LEDRLTPAIATWDGGGADNHWTTAANWVGDLTPQAGDDLVFPNGATQLANVNDFASGTAFHSLAITAGNYQISGNSVDLAAGVNADIPVLGRSELMLSIGGAGGVTMNGPGGIILSAENTFTGPTLLHFGYTNVTSNHGLGASGGATTVDRGSTLTFIGPVQTDEPITLGGYENLDTGLSAIGDVVLNGAITLSTDEGGVIEGGVIGGSLSIRGSVTGTTNAVLTLNGAIRFESTSTVDVGQISLFEGTILVNGRITRGAVGSAIVPGASTVGGVGTLALLAANGFRLTPGDGGVGTLTTGDILTDGSHLNIDLGSSGADRIAVHGTVRLDLNDLPTDLQIAAAPGFTLPPNAIYRIIDNDGTDPISGVFLRLPQGAVATTINGVPLYINYKGGDGNDVELTVSRPAPFPVFAVGADAGGGPFVQVYGNTGTLLRTIVAYDVHFTGGVRVTLADITGDGVEDIITSPGPGGGPHIRVFDGVTFAVVREFMAYNPAFVGGVFVGTTDFNYDGRMDIITGAGAGGGPHVECFSGTNNAVLASFMAYDPRFTGGVSVAGIFSDIATGPGAGAVLPVRVFSQLSGTAQLFQEVNAFPNFRGPVFVASQRDTAGHLRDSLVVSAGTGGGPHVKVYRFFDYFPPPVFGLVAEFFAYDARFAGGVRIAGADIDGDGIDEIITGAGPGGGPHVKAWRVPMDSSGTPPTLVSSFLAFDPAFTGGIYVG
jgi:hypothetical protein